MNLRFFASIVCVLGVFFSLGGGAVALSGDRIPVVLVIDQGRILTQSHAGKSVIQQLDEKRERARKVIKKQIEDLQLSQKQLLAQKDLIDKNLLQKKAEDLQKKQESIYRLRDRRLKELSAMEQRALTKIGDAMRPILKKIVQDRGVTVLIDRSSVVFVADSVDVTERVLGDLNKKLTHISVE